MSSSENSVARALPPLSKRTPYEKCETEPKFPHLLSGTPSLKARHAVSGQAHVHMAVAVLLRVPIGAIGIDRGTFNNACNSLQ